MPFGIEKMMRGCLVVFFLAWGFDAHAFENSGFFTDYSKLESKVDAKGVERKIWVNEKLNRDNYKSIMIDALDFFPTVESSDKNSLDQLNVIREYMEIEVKKSIGTSLPMVSQPGAGVIKMRWAITAASIDKSIKPYQLIPVALMVTAIKRGAGVATYDVKLSVETEFLDSLTGEVLARSVREAKDLQVKGDQPLTLNVVKSHIDSWVEAVESDVFTRLGSP